MARNAGLRPRISVQMRTPGWVPAAGWKNAASHTPSTVRMSTSFSTTSRSAPREAAAARPMAAEVATNSRRVAPDGDFSSERSRSEPLMGLTSLPSSEVESVSVYDAEGPQLLCREIEKYPDFRQHVGAARRHELHRQRYRLECPQHPDQLPRRKIFGNLVRQRSYDPLA